MRTFNKFRPTFWGSGETGRLLRPHPESTRLLAIWAFTNERALAEPWGLYHCSVHGIVDGLGSTPAKVSSGLATLAEVGFAFHDARTEWLWVVNLAAEQLLVEGKALKPTDNMSLAANRWYSRCPTNPFLGAYFDRYVTLLHLDTRRNGGAPPVAAPVAPVEPEADAPEQPLLLPLPPPPDVAKKTSPAERRDAEFDLFWAGYHERGKSSKKKAREVYMRLKPVSTDVLAGLERWRASQRWTDGYVVDAEKWLKEERWQETPPPAKLPGLSERTRDVVEALDSGRSIFDLDDQRPAVPLKRLKG